jgi:hypothetical protein
MRAGALAAGLAVVAALPSAALAAPKPDLVEAGLASTPSTVAAGSALPTEETASNVGNAGAGKSVTRFYLSRDAEKSRGDTRLEGKRSVPRLGRDQSSSGSSEPTIPLDTPREDLHLLACADDRKDVRERREGNNCVASDETLEVGAPCTDRLTALGVAFEKGPDRPGVVSPVTVETPLNGISYSNSNDQPAGQLYMDCTLALALHEMAPVMSSHGLDHVQHLGIYNYRCIADPGPPPDCPNGISRHAYADAIDIMELRSAGGETYNVNDDWVIDADIEPTCSAGTSGAKDALMHAFVCDLFEGGVFNILLTPNYNAAHRNHFHLDLTPGAGFID